MQIRQLQVTNDSVQDRLLLRIATDSNEEIRIFLTRHFLRELWPALTGMLAGHLQSQPSAAPLEPAAKPAAQSSFEQAFRNDNPTYPLGSNPLLASEAGFEAGGDGVARLTLREGRERNIAFNLNNELLQALCAMLRAASEQARWDLPLDYRAPSAQPAVPGKSLLH